MTTKEVHDASANGGASSEAEYILEWLVKRIGGIGAALSRTRKAMKGRLLERAAKNQQRNFANSLG